MPHGLSENQSLTVPAKDVAIVRVTHGKVLIVDNTEEAIVDGPAAFKVASKGTLHIRAIEPANVHLQPPEVEVVVEDAEDLSDLTKDELRKRATEADIVGRGSMTKAQLIEALGDA